MRKFIFILMMLVSVNAYGQDAKVFNAKHMRDSLEKVILDYLYELEPVRTELGAGCLFFKGINPNLYLGGGDIRHLFADIELQKTTKPSPLKKTSDSYKELWDGYWKCIDKLYKSNSYKQYVTYCEVIDNYYANKREESDRARKQNLMNIIDNFMD